MKNLALYDGTQRLLYQVTSGYDIEVILATSNLSLSMLQDVLSTGVELEELLMSIKLLKNSSKNNKINE